MYPFTHTRGLNHIQFHIFFLNSLCDKNSKPLPELCLPCVMISVTGPYVLSGVCTIGWRAYVNVCSKNITCIWTAPRQGHKTVIPGTLTSKPGDDSPRVYLTKVVWAFDTHLKKICSSYSKILVRSVQSIVYVTIAECGDRCRFVIWLGH